MDPGDCAKWCPFQARRGRIGKDSQGRRRSADHSADDSRQARAGPFSGSRGAPVSNRRQQVRLRIAEALPAPLQGVGLFHPGAEHIETNPDFFGIMAAFESREGRRVDFLGLTIPRLQQTITRISQCPPCHRRILGCSGSIPWGSGVLRRSKPDCRADRLRPRSQRSPWVDQGGQNSLSPDETNAAHVSFQHRLSNLLDRN